MRYAKVRPASSIPIASRRYSKTLFPFYLIPLDSLLERACEFEKETSESYKMESYQDLMDVGLLRRWETIKDNDTIIFVSHEWCGWSHPDPQGVQLNVLLEVLQNLKTGKIKGVNMCGFYSRFVGSDERTKAKDWVNILSSAYVWIDWSCMPQPEAEKTRKVPLLNKALVELQKDSNSAIDSIGAYVERSDIVIVLVPTCTHADRIDPKSKQKVHTCYRTWRSRGWCVLELYAAFMARSKTVPVLRVTSKESTPEWMSPYEPVFLSLGATEFSCCQRNHLMSKDDKSKVTPCDRPRCLSIARPMLDNKIIHLFEHDKDFTRARLIQSLRKRFLSGLSNTVPGITSNYEDTSIGKDDDLFLKEQVSDVVLRLKAILRWRTGEDGDWFDRGGISILIYAIMREDLECTCCGGGEV